MSEGTFDLGSNSKQSNSANILLYVMMVLDARWRQGGLPAVKKKRFGTEKRGKCKIQLQDREGGDWVSGGGKGGGEMWRLQGDQRGIGIKG